MVMRVTAGYSLGSAAAGAHSHRPLALFQPCVPGTSGLSSNSHSYRSSGTPGMCAAAGCAAVSTRSTSRSSRQLTRTMRLVPCARAGGSSSNGGRPSGNGGGVPPRRSSKPERKARQPGLFEVKVVSPPPRSLGIFALPPNTHNGEQIEIDGQGYVVTSLVLQYKLVKGKYKRDHSRLEVQPTGRFFLNMMLDNLIHATYMGETGQQD